MSNKWVQSFRSIREEETAIFIKKISKSPGPVDLSKMFAEYSNDGICRSAFGRKFGELENGKKFLSLVIGLSEVLGAIVIGEYIPWLSWISRVNGFDEKVENIAKGLDEFLEGVIEDRLKIKKEQAFQDKNGENFVDILLEGHNDNTAADVSIDRDSIKAIILEEDEKLETLVVLILLITLMFLTIMQNIIYKVVEKLQSEVREIVKNKNEITNDDLEKMHYLKAVIKETLRYHPPFPLLVPRIARADVKIKGYDISAGTIVMVSARAIGRDPALWDEPEKFKPERFLNSSIDFKGLDFELIPFGAGRRGCPGITYSVATIEFLLANLVQKFDWELPNGVKGKDLDMSEKPGITIHKATPLLAVATKIP